MAIQIDAKSYNFSEKDEIFIDTNVWLYIFYPGAEGDHGYNDIFQKIIDSGANLYITEQVLSEYVNRVVRGEYHRYIESQKEQGNRGFIDYKRSFRPTAEYSTAYNLALDSVNEDILSIAKLVSISHEDVCNWCTEYEMLDFNDNVYFHLSLKNNFFILTHDKDFLEPTKEVRIMRS